MDLPYQGLTSAEAAELRRKGLGNRAPAATSRSYARIFYENVFTFINNILFLLGIGLVALDRTSDAIFSVGVILANVIVSVVQEIRAKQTLDRIAMLTRPTASVIRDGKEITLDPAELVVGDLLALRAGDQVVVDGQVLNSERLDLDESLLTGESDLIPKKAGDTVFSGSFCIHGSGYYRADKVGSQSLANTMTSGARAFRRVLTPLQQQINLVLRIILAAAVFMIFLLFIRSSLNQTPLVEIVKMSVVIIGLVPNGLFLAISVAYALGAVRMAGKGALVQQANAVESLSNVDVLCLDKTGTLTANRLRYYALMPAGISEAELRACLGDFAASTPSGNRTSRAIADALAGKPLPIIDEVPFSSERKWSALAFDTPQRGGVYVLGAPEVLAPALKQAWDEPASLANRALWDQGDAWAQEGLRVLLFAGMEGKAPLYNPAGEPCLPQDITPLGMVCLEDELRPDAQQTLRAFTEAGVRLKIISGDNPETVAALARRAGLETGDKSQIKVVSGLELDRLETEQFERAAEECTIFGRITPQQKEKLVQALRKRQHYVAMIGDGVNDILSLKGAHLGIAMQSGSQATRGVADIVLIGDSFAALPPAVQEGRRIINGMQDILKLFMTRVLYVALLVVSVGVVGGFPYAPKNISILTLLTVGIPTILLALWAQPAQVSYNRLIRQLLHFVIPAGVTISLAGLFIYLVYFVPIYTSALASDTDTSLFASGLAAPQAALTHFTILCGLLLIIFAEPPVRFLEAGDYYTGDRRPAYLALGLLLFYILILLVPGLRQFLDISAPDLNLPDYLIIALAALLWAALIRWIWRRRFLDRFFGTTFME